MRHAWNQPTKEQHRRYSAGELAGYNRGTSIGLMPVTVASDSAPEVVKHTEQYDHSRSYHRKNLES